MQEKVEIITNHFEHYWTKIPKNGYCAQSEGVDYAHHIIRPSYGPWVERALDLDSRQ